MRQYLYAALVCSALAATPGSHASPASHPVAALPVVQHWLTYSDPQEDAFSIEMPRGWKLSGGTARRNALQYRGWALAISPDGSTILAANDPSEPSYVAPNPMLAMAGFRIGSVYGGGGGTVYLVEPYRTGQQYAALWGRRKLARECNDIRLVNARARPEVAQQINVYSRPYGIVHDAGEATFQCNKGGVAMTAYVFVSTTDIAFPGYQGGIWYADTIAAFLSPTPVSGIAAGLLAHMVKSVRVNPAWVQRQTGAEAKVSQIAAETNAHISDSIMRGWEDRGAQYDRVMEEGSRARLGIDVYADPATGTQYTVANTHEYYWVNPGGTVVGTDTDTAPGASFERLNRVPPR